jgi:Bax protein
MKWLPITLLITLIIAMTPGSTVMDLYVNAVQMIEKEISASLVKASNIPAEEIESTHGTIQDGTPLVASATEYQNERIPDFSAFHDVRQKKRVFFEFMLPLIREANASIRVERAELVALSRKLENGSVLSGGEHLRLAQLFNQYRFDLPQLVEAVDIGELLERVDIVPASLVLAQSANESGWGTSRFATEANNYFGIWCFSRGCGLAPRQRDEGLSHEVASYDSVQQGVIAYMRNINTHKAYTDLRTIRAEQRQIRNHQMGERLANGLHRYSERGQAYVDEIQQMIRVNNLQEYTLPTSV